MNAKELVTLALLETIRRDKAGSLTDKAITKNGGFVDAVCDLWDTPSWEAVRKASRFVEPCKALEYAEAVAPIRMDYKPQGEEIYRLGTLCHEFLTKCVILEQGAESFNPDLLQEIAVLARSARRVTTGGMFEEALKKAVEAGNISGFEILSRGQEPFFVFVGKAKWPWLRQRWHCYVEEGRDFLAKYCTAPEVILAKVWRENVKDDREEAFALANQEFFAEAETFASFTLANIPPQHLKVAPWVWQELKPMPRPRDESKELPWDLVHADFVRGVVWLEKESGKDTLNP